MTDSQSAVPQAVEAFDPSPAPGEVNEFGYRPISTAAVVTLCLGGLSAIGLAWVFGLGICVFGIAVGFVSLRKIHRAAGELGGRVPALLGFWLSVIFLVWGSALHAYNYQTELPEGCRRINFTQDISKKGFVYEKDGMKVHPDVRALDDQTIFIKGYMYPTGQMEGITAFTLVKDNQQCCFGGQPAMQDMILVRMQKGKTAEYEQALVAVAGTLRIAGKLSQGQTTPVYELDAFHFSVAKTSF